MSEVVIRWWTGQQGQHHRLPSRSRGLEHLIKRMRCALRLLVWQVRCTAEICAPCARVQNTHRRRTPGSLRSLSSM